jgi:hypothetical protein
VRFERGERIVRDLGLRRTDRRDQCRLAGVRESDQRGVGEQLELELEPLLLAVFALLGKRRCAPRIRQEPRVAAPTLPAARREPSIAMAHQVGEQLAVARPNGGSFGNIDHEVGAALAVQLLALTVRSRHRLPMRMIAKRE